MSKVDTYYFSHDATAKDDPKCVMLIEQLGLEGYGIFWVLVETLRGQPDYRYPIKLIQALARRYNTSAEKMSTVINNYDLFKIEEEKFFSLRLLRNMEEYNAQRTKYIEAGRRGGQASVKQRLSKGQAIKAKQSKGNESMLLAEIVFPLMRESTNKNTITDRQLHGEVSLFIEKYQGQEIKNLTALVNSWAANVKPQKPMKVVI